MLALAANLWARFKANLKQNLAAGDLPRHLSGDEHDLHQPLTITSTAARVW